MGNENNEKKLYSDPRWNDKQLPKVIGHIEFTEEEQKKKEQFYKEYLRQEGYIIDDE